MPVERPIDNNDGTVTYKGVRYFKDYFKEYRPDLQDNKPVIVDKTGTKELPVLLLEVVVTPRETLKLSPNYPIYTISSPGPNENAPYGYYNIGGGYGAIGKWIPITEEMYNNGVHDGLYLTEMSDPADNALNWLMAGGLAGGSAIGASSTAKGLFNLGLYDAAYPYIKNIFKPVGLFLGSKAAKLAMALGLISGLDVNALLMDDQLFLATLPGVKNSNDYKKYLTSIDSEEALLESLTGLKITSENLDSIIQNLTPDLLKIFKGLANEDTDYRLENGLYVSNNQGNGFWQTIWEHPALWNAGYFGGKYGVPLLFSPVRDYYNIDPEYTIDVTPVRDGKYTTGETTADVPENSKIKTVKNKIRGPKYTYAKGKLPGATETTTIPERQWKHPTLYKISKTKAPWFDILFFTGTTAAEVYNDFFNTKDSEKKLAEEHYKQVGAWARNIVERYENLKFRQQMLQDKEKAVQEKIDSLPITVTKSNDSVLAIPDSTGGKPATPGRFTQQVDSVN